MFKSMTPPSVNEAELDPPFYEELSPDLRWRIYQGEVFRQRLTLTVTVGLTAALLLPVGVFEVNQRADQWVAQLMGHAQSSGAVAMLDPGSPLEEGEVVAGHRISSGYGARSTVGLPDGASEEHLGVDVATAPATAVHAVGDAGLVKVRCWQDSAGGGLVADIYPAGGETYYQALHLSECATGFYEPGQVIAKTGASGIGTGPHLDWRERSKAGKVHQHPTSGPLVAALTGVPPVQSLNSLELACRIGRAEGTRDGSCNPTWAYWGHYDPGNGAWNQGSFSYQHEDAATPVEADQQQLDKLSAFRTQLNDQAVKKFGQPLSMDATLSALDLFTQSESAAGDFVRHLNTSSPTRQEIKQARAASYIDPETGQLDAPGLDNDMLVVESDQSRRTEAVLAPLTPDDPSKLD